MYRNPVTSQYILDFKKCPIEVDIQFERKFLRRKWNPAVYFQVDDHVDPGILLQQFQVKIMIFIQKFAITCRVGLWNKQMPYFSSVSDEWSRDLKSVRYRNSVHVEGNPTMNLRELNGMIVKREVLMVVGVKQPFGEKKRDELVDGTVDARVDVLGKVIPRRLLKTNCKLVKTSISVDGKLVHALLDSGTEITVIKKDLVPGISVEGASTIYLKEVLVEDVLLPPDVLDMLGGAQSEENSLAQSSQDLRVDSGNVDETEGRDEEVTAEMDKGIMVADSFRSEQELCRVSIGLEVC
ncbi:CCHC-type domain-containing protein [Trichonephila clavipes]|nr:CCHC-type domain-containing protein [Trichonephila clavipes]